jgi:hypothetical protein
MGFFSGLMSAGASFVSSVVSVGSSIVSSAWSAAKEVAGKAVGWMAEQAEHFVGGIKGAWQAVKPFVGQIRSVLQAAAKSIPIPWLSTALSLLDKGIGALTAFENSPIAKKVDAAIKWAIDLAKRWQASKQEKAVDEAQQDAGLSEAELEKARQHQETFRFAEREAMSDSTRHQLELAAAINDYEIARTELGRAIEAEPENFEHYLRLRATQKLLAMADKKFRSATTVDELSVDDLFLVRIASDLIKPSPELSKEAAARLDRLLEARYRKKLAPFVYEELIASWAKRAEVLENQWAADNRSYVKDNMLLKRLQLAQDIQGELSVEETAELARLRVDVPVRKQELDALAVRQHDMQRYVGAAEGFLQLLEKSPQQIEEEDRGYLLDEGPRVGQILIDCAQNDRAFSQLDPEEQSLVTDFANVFQMDSKNRMNDILEVMA